MKHRFLSRAAEFLAAQRRRKRWVKVVSAMAAVVVFCTTYALILPAITMEKDPVCGLEEHQHDETCYAPGTPVIQRELVCTLENQEVHQHTEECFDENGALICDIPEVQEHVHSDACFEEREVAGEPVLICGLPEHQHTADCYPHEEEEESEPEEEQPTGDPNADVETRAIWEATLPKTLTGDWAEDVITVASSQLGYTESTKNYIVLEDGSQKGYSRYGAWYGDPYGDWCAMFVSFCLHYAQVEDFPLDANCVHWIQELKKLERYAPAEEYTPRPGDLVFFDWDEDGQSDHVGLVEELKDDTLITIEGNDSNRVARVKYEKDAPEILGYGILPENGEPVTLTAAIYTDERYETPAGDSTRITVTGVIPEGAQVRAFPVEVELAEETVLCAYDISIYLADGSLFEPEEPLSVRFLLPEREEETADCKVVYVPERGEPEPVQAVAEDGGVTFKAEHFSVYAVLAVDGTVSNEAELETAVENDESFHYTDESTGLTVTLTLENSYYVPETFDLVVDRQDAGNYTNALNSFTTHGQVIKEAAIYKIYLVQKDNNQMHTNLGCAYTLEMSWPKGLFAQKDSSDLLNFTYCKNSGSEPTELSNCQVTYSEDGNVTALTATDSYYPNSAEFMFVQSSAPNGLTAGNYKLTYNEVKDAFLTDPAYSQYYNSNSPIGTAGSFHIVAFDSANLNAHTNGNVLAKNLYAGANFGTSNFAHELSYIQCYKTVNGNSASSNDHVLVIGSENTVEFVDNGNAFSINGTKIDKPQNLIQDKDTAAAPFIDLNRVRAEISQISGNLNGYPDANLTYTSAANLNADHSKLELTTPSGVGVVNYTANGLKENLGSYVQIDGFQTGSNGTVVINVDCTGVTQIDMPQARIVIDGQMQGTSEVTEFSAGKVIWNFVNASDVTINTHLMTGIILAPGATVNIKQNLNGTVVADTINVNAESHRTDFTGKVTEPEETPEENEYYVTVQKIETGYAGSALPGAEFDLYMWKGNEWGKINTDTLITGQNGTVMLRNLEVSVAYKLVETKPPKGYVLKDGAFYFWVRTDTDQTHPSQCPSDFSGSMVEVGGTLLAANDKNAEGDYSLPETGGLGTLLYVIGGLILMAGSGYLLYRKNRDGRGAL